MPAFSTSFSHSPPTTLPSVLPWSPSSALCLETWSWSRLIPVGTPVQRLPDSDEALVMVTGSQNSHSLQGQAPPILTDLSKYQEKHIWEQIQMLWARSRTMRKTAAAAGVEGKSKGRWLGAVGRGDCGDEVGSWLGGGGQGRICLTGVAGHGAVSSSILSLQPWAGGWRLKYSWGGNRRLSFWNPTWEEHVFFFFFLSVLYLLSFRFFIKM